MVKGRGRKKKFNKFDETIGRHSTQTNCSTSSSDISRANQSIDSIASEEPMSNSLKTLSIENSEDNISLGNNSLAEQQSSSRSDSNLTQVSESSYKNSPHIWESSEDNSSEVLQLQCQESSTEMWNVNALAFIPNSMIQSTANDSSKTLDQKSDGDGKNGCQNDEHKDKNEDKIFKKKNFRDPTFSIYKERDENQKSPAYNSWDGHRRNNEKGIRSNMKSFDNKIYTASTRKYSRDESKNKDLDSSAMQNIVSEDIQIRKNLNDSGYNDGNENRSSCKGKSHTFHQRRDKGESDWHDNKSSSYASGDESKNKDLDFPAKQNKISKDINYSRYNDGNKKKNRSKGKNAADEKVDKGEPDWCDNKSSNYTDKEYEQCQDEWKQNKDVKFLKINEQDKDLFAMPHNYSLAHCVAEDMRMGSGIAVQFKRYFKAVDELLQQRAKQGGLAFLELHTDNGVRYIYYLVTKRVSTGKPTYETFWSSVKKMRDHIRDNKVEKLAMPRIGCGLDRLEWSKVKHMIEFLFKEVDVEIVICNFQQSEESPRKDYSSCKVVHEHKSVADIEPQTIIIYLSTEDGHVSDDMKKLNEKFNFQTQFQLAEKRLGDLIKFEHSEYFLYGCIVRKTAKSSFDFLSFRKCLDVINKNNKQDKFEYVAIQAIADEDDPTFNEKLITSLRSGLRNVDIYVCWNDDLVSQMPPKRDYKKASIEYQSPSGSDNKRVSIEHQSLPGRDNKEESIESQCLPGRDKRATTEYQSPPERDNKEVSIDYWSPPGRDNKDGSIESQWSPERDNKRASVEYQSTPERDNKEASIEYRSPPGRDNKEVPIETQWRSGRDNKKASIESQSPPERDNKEVSIDSQRPPGRDNKKASMKVNRCQEERTKKRR